MDRIFERAFNKVEGSIKASTSAETSQQQQQQTEEDRLRNETVPMTAEDAINRICLAWKDGDYFRYYARTSVPLFTTDVVC